VLAKRFEIFKLAFVIGTVGGDPMIYKTRYRKKKNTDFFIIAKI
jgi:hypothetical protein